MLMLAGVMFAELNYPFAYSLSLIISDEKNVHTVNSRSTRPIFFVVLLNYICTSRSAFLSFHTTIIKCILCTKLYSNKSGKSLHFSKILTRPKFFRKDIISESYIYYIQIAFTSRFEKQFLQFLLF